MFGLKKVKIDKRTTVWLKKLSLTDFLGSEYVPLISHAIEDPEESTDTVSDDTKSHLRILFDKAIAKIKGFEKDDFIDLVLKNDALTSLLYNYIYFNSDKKKTFRQLLSASL